MVSPLHPTAKLLVETVSNLLEKRQPDSVQVDEVLELSGISKGSLYHHFEDLQELVEVAQIQRYSQWIDASIEFLTTEVARAQNKKTLMDALRRLTVLTQSDQRKSARAERSNALAACINNPRMALAMGLETKRLTEAIKDIIDEVKNKGLFKQEVNSKALATFIQAYSLGKIVNDHNPNGVNEEEWIDFVMDITENTFLAP